uniref:Apolipophorin-III n=1 Tax=Antheraea pernyi TaxID=7119 RepID=A0A0A0Q684_ANTPE|nr:apolipophorin-III [Antheraea pernyi]
MAIKCFILFACVALAQGAMVRRDAPNNVWQDMEKHAKTFQKTISDGFNQMVNSKNTQEFNKALKDGSDSVLQQLSKLSSSLQSVLNDANGKAKTVFEKTDQDIKHTIEELRKAHPEVEKQTTELRDKLQAAIQNTVQVSQNMAKEVSAHMDETNQKLAPKVKEAYDDFVKHAEELQKKLHEAAAKQ